ncbi:MAG: S8/S53 family peptidase [Saprospiraceae bacterium]
MKIKSLVVILLTGLFLHTQGFAQSSWVVELKGGATAQDLTNGWAKTSLRSNQISKVRLIASHFNIYEVNTATTYSKKQLLENPAILYADPNVELEIRTTPNDPLINQEWHLNNISALKAWDQTTGGLTFNKDTLVLGVIDFGVNIEHEDLKNRIWKNKGEIPGNNKDDDGNGYIDDVNGLSLRYLSERQSVDNNTDGLGNHGTSVAGLMGGESNNKIGISGMMWNSKLMIATFSANGNIADLIEMMNYMLDQRKRYNDSKGKEGALVVTINYSGGISFAKAADYPIWCGMYDKMGAVGILNCGATTNKYVDVDDEGDMPSTCPSEFLIAVTNTGQDNKRIYNAGFGLQHIDLGSPGEGVYSTRSDNTNSYGAFSGTSAATPIVAGAVGLMYSYPCKEWADYLISHPVEAARIVKKSLLASVDKNADLTGKSVSGGRLNIARALDTLKKYACTSQITSIKNELTIRSISPNPASNYINIQLDNNQSGEYKMTFYDIVGRKVAENNNLNISPAATIYLPVLSNGIYVLNLVGDAGIASRRILIGQ